MAARHVFVFFLFFHVLFFSLSYFLCLMSNVYYCVHTVGKDKLSGRQLFPNCFVCRFKVCLLYNEISFCFLRAISFILERSIFKRGSVYRKVNKKSQKLSLL